MAFLFIQTAVKKTHHFLIKDIRFFNGDKMISARYYLYYAMRKRLCNLIGMSSGDHIILSDDQQHIV